MGKKFLRLPAVKAKTGLSKSTIYLMIRKGAFPAPVKLGPRTSGWLEAEIEEWTEDRIAERDESWA
ncbi:hypothetical protein JCM12294_16380 [Desulfocicer niacini]